MKRGYLAHITRLFISLKLLLPQKTSPEVNTQASSLLLESMTKKGPLPEALHKTFLNLYESRVTSDYSVEAVPSSDETKGSRSREKIHRISRELFAGVAGKVARGITLDSGFFLKS